MLCKYVVQMLYIFKINFFRKLNRNKSARSHYFFLINILAIKWDVVPYDLNISLLIYGDICLISFNFLNFFCKLSLQFVPVWV